MDNNTRTMGQSPEMKTLTLSGDRQASDACKSFASAHSELDVLDGTLKVYDESMPNLSCEDSASQEEFAQPNMSNPDKLAAFSKFEKRVRSKAMELRREAKLPKKDYDPQSFVNSAFIMAVQKKLLDGMSDVILKRLSILASAVTVYSECTTKRQFIATSVLTAEALCEKSVVNTFKEFAINLMGLEPQSSDSTLDDAVPEWMSLMKKGLLDWKSLITNPGATKIFRLISMMVTLGIFQGPVEISLGGLQLFAAEAQSKQVHAVDFIDACVETIVFFAEGAHQCFTTGSLRPLLFADAESAKMDEEYVRVLGYYEYVRNGNLEKYTDVTVQTFEAKLEKLVERYNQAYRLASHSMEKKILFDRFKHLSQIKIDHDTSRVRGGLRESPVVIKIYGESGVGKSTLADIFMHAALKAGGHPDSDDHIITHNVKDPYMSTMRSYVSGIKLDDYGNGKLEYMTCNPSEWIITLCNNVKEYAVMADLSNKGKILIDPRCVTITTNVEDLLAGKLSHSPISIVRRAHIHVSVRVKPEWCKVIEGRRTTMLDDVRVAEHFGDAIAPDIWEIDIKDVKSVESKTEGAWAFVMVRQGISVVDATQYIVDFSKRHYAAQKQIVSNNKNMNDKMTWCKECDMPTFACKKTEKCCCEEEIEPQTGERLAQTLAFYGRTKAKSLAGVKREFEYKAEDIAVEKALETIQYLETSPLFQWTNFIPTSWLDDDRVKGFIFWTKEDVIVSDVKKTLRNYAIMCILSSLVCLSIDTSFGLMMILILSGFYLWIHATVVEQVKESFYRRIRDEHGAVPKMFKKMRDQYAQYACGAFAGFAAVYGVVLLYKALRSQFKVQTSLNPVSVKEIKERDSTENVWARNDVVEPIPPSGVQPSQILDRVRKHQAYLRIDRGEAFEVTIVWVACSNTIIIPHHVKSDTPLKCELSLNKGFKREFILSNGSRTRINEDLDLVDVPTLGSVRDSLPLITDALPSRKMPCNMSIIDGSCEFSTTSLEWSTMSNVNNGAVEFVGSYYELGIVTYGGLCMAPIYTMAPQPRVIGFHIGGRTGYKSGCGIGITKLALEAALAKHRESFPLLPQSNPVEDSQYGKKFSVPGGLHKKSPLNFIDENNNSVVYYGPITGRVTQKSNVEQSPISAEVERVTGVPNKWGPPRFTTPKELPDGTIVQTEAWKPWFKTLDVASKPCIGFPAEDVARAADDYLSGLHEVFQRNSEYWSSEMKPLSKVEIVSGIDGKRFIDQMPASTSMGFPIMGPKRNYLIDLDPEVHDDHMSPRTFTPEIWEEVDRITELFRKGEMANCIFNAVEKDEPTLLTKEKVRHFQSAPVALQIVIRKYFLPVARFLSMNPLVAECAVGINAHGSEWEEMETYICEYGTDRILAGDYSKYDLRMPAQLILRAFDIMTTIAQWSGNYSPDDIAVMRSVRGEVAYPLMAYNGDLIRLTGSNPSGQNLTVYINSIVNSLLWRMGFFNAYPNFKGNAREAAHMIIYGDDIKGGVKEGFELFNHISFADFLSRNDMVFTMPDKESKPVEYMNDADADFLKRKNAFLPELGHYVGQLAEDSIFKSLHSNLKSKAVSSDEVAAGNIDGALREWFFYGREHFEKRRMQMIEVAKSMPIKPSTLSEDFDSRKEEWLKRYHPQSGSISKEDNLQKTVCECFKKGPIAQEYTLYNSSVGCGDLVFETEVHKNNKQTKVFVVVETKCIVGRPELATKVESQAIKYSEALAVLRPDAVIIGMTYTEYGFAEVYRRGYTPDMMGLLRIL